MTLIDRPWTRVRKPVPIPEVYTVTDLQQMADVAFAELVRSHLVPRDQSPAGREAWDRFWKTLRENDQLANRTYDVLDDFLDTTEDALSSGDLDDAGTTRATKFQQQCEMSWKRIDRDRQRGALAWAGNAAKFPPHARRVIATLVGAIARHRSAVLRDEAKPTRADTELWDTMHQLGLDPRDHPPLDEQS